MKILQTVFLFLFLLQLNAIDSFSASKSDINDYWQKTKLQFTDVESLVTSQNCYSDPTVFIGCIYAINAVLANNTPVLFLTPKNMIDLPDEIGEIFKDFGLVQAHALVSLDRSKTSVIESIQKMRSERSRFYESWTSLAKLKKQISFETILKWAKHQVINQNNESYVSAEAINHYLSITFDPHTYILPNAYIQEELSSGEENFAGVGAVITKMNGKFFIRQILDGSPALKAGLKAKDEIIEINNESLQNTKLDLTEVVGKIKGPLNTKVKLTVLRDGKTLELDIIRGNISIENVTSKVLHDREKNFGYIHLSSFMEEQACSKIENSILEFKKNQVEGIILDLRGDGGGLLSQAQCIADLFLDKNKLIVSIRPLTAGYPSQELFSQKPKITDLPLIVLIDSSSASASEIIAGAFQDHQRAVILGERSYGKGSVQRPFEYYTNPEIKLMRTIARFYLPSGRTNQVSGVTPDIEAFSNPNPSEEDKFAVREEDMYQNALPPQGAPWIQPRPEYIQNIKLCSQITGVADLLYNDRDRDAIAPDYPLLLSEDILTCMKP